MEFSSPVERVEDGLYLSEQPTFFERLKVGIRALRVLDKAPDDPVAQPLFNAALDGDTYGRLVEALRQTDAGLELLTERPTLERKDVDLAALGALPEGTLGHAFSRYFEENRIQPFTSPYEVRNDTDYLVKRYRETHDLAHIVTGYGTDALGEMEVQAFAIGNLGLRSAWVILGFAAVLMPHGLPPIWRYTDRLRVAHRRGKEAKSLLTLRYERYWKTPVSEVRRLLDLNPLLPH